MDVTRMRGGRGCRRGFCPPCLTACLCMLPLAAACDWFGGNPVPTGDGEEDAPDVAPAETDDGTVAESDPAADDPFVPPDGEEEEEADLMEAEDTTDAAEDLPPCIGDEDGDGYGEGETCLGPDCDETSARCTTICEDADHDLVYDCKDDCMDADGDGYGSGTACLGPDCDETSARCASVCEDADHDLVYDCKDDCMDADWDGYGSGTACLGPDCDDSTPRCTSLCVDVDGDGAIDCLDDCVDVDGDGYGVGPACSGPDCDDGNDAVNPGMPEICNALDDNCDGSVNEGSPDLVVPTGTTLELAGIIPTCGHVQIDGTLLVRPYDGTSGGYLELHAGGDIVVSASGRITADGAGYRESEGPGAGGCEGGGSAGGSHGGRGGDSCCGSFAGPVYGDASSAMIEMGSGGGRGRGCGEGTGGSGGGAIYLIAPQITISGLVSANGTPNLSHSDWSPGGGAGGGILLVATIQITFGGTLRAMGGAPEPATWGGGGGGGGRIKLIAPTGSNTGAVSVSGGAGGSGTWNGYAGQAGSIYVSF
jgi:hypothetical protein